MVKEFEPIPLLTHYRGQKIPSQPAFAITRTKEVLKFTSSDKKKQFCRAKKKSDGLNHCCCRRHRRRCRRHRRRCHRQHRCQSQRRRRHRRSSSRVFGSSSNFRHFNSFFQQKTVRWKKYCARAMKNEF